MLVKNRNFWIVFIPTVLFIMLSILSLNRHSKAKIYTYHSEIWADKAGYYIYLPAFFIYDFETNKFPDKVDVKTGNGFVINKNTNKINTKYTYGVALMQSPFFLCAHSIALKSGLEADGFSFIYNKMINFAAATYSVLGLLLLYLFLIKYVDNRVAILGLTVLFLGSNLFYYAIFDTGMSHVYSFFLFSAFLLLQEKFFNKSSNLVNVIFGLVVGLIIAVRPINLIFLPVCLIFNNTSKLELKTLFKPTLIVVIIAFLVIMPQFFYWKYLSGNFFYYAYSNERFTNFLSPKILEILFSPNNGLLIYNPIILFCLFGLIFCRKIYPSIFRYLGIYLIFLTYLFSSWWNWSYGCSYGSRPFVEYYSLLSLPLCLCTDIILKSNFRRIYFFVIIFMIVWNLKLIFSYDGCWYGGNWDWIAFKDLLVSKTK